MHHNNNDDHDTIFSRYLYNMYIGSLNIRDRENKNID